MRNRNLVEFCKNAVGTVFLLAGAFFVCSTLLSMRAVFADPIAPVPVVTANGPQSPRAGTTARATGRTTTRANASNSTVARTTATSARGVSSRPSNAARTTATSRTVVSRGNANTNTVSRPTATNASRTAVTSRNVVSRGNAATSGNASRAATTRAAGTSRNVVSRSATNRTTMAPRVSLTGNAIRASTSSISSSYSYLAGKLYTGNYANIIDSSTGLISAEAYNNCMESYYTCMDEICTARNAAQRRCACAGRVRAFAEAQTALESANEELIKVSGELALLIATNGKDVSDAFQLTDAEKVMNCVSWQETTGRYGVNSTQAVEWCYAHNIYGNNGQTLTNCPKPSYCSISGNNFGFDITNIDGSGSDILASLQSWADAKEQTLTITRNDNNGLLSAFDMLSDVVSGMAGIDGALTSSDKLTDSLAETWGYELFEYAHNNVCNRVLDSCFNGIYEACGAPPSSGRKCTNGASQCPYNYNTMISVTNTGTYELNFVTPNNGYTASNSASCFGYSSTGGDPYSSLRGPVADARRSILQKYALDANADCDAYGEQLRTAAQNIGYQKMAAQQALQQKRLEFSLNESNNVSAEYRTAISNFNECLSELYDCYTTQADAYDNWSNSRIKTYCQQVSNVPHCYEPMICASPNNTLQAVISVTDDGSRACVNSTEYKENTCRNLVTISEVLNGSYANGAAAGSSPALREMCLQNYGINGIRNWTRKDGAGTDWDDSDVKCGSGSHMDDNGRCIENIEQCDCADANPADANAKTCQKKWNGSWGQCVTNTCKTGYRIGSEGTCNACVAGYEKVNGACVPIQTNTECTAAQLSALNATDGILMDDGKTCKPMACASGYTLQEGTTNNQCVEDISSSDTSGAFAKQQQACTNSGGTWANNACTCPGGYDLNNGKCEVSTPKEGDACTPSAAHAATGTIDASGDCKIATCDTGYKLEDNECVRDFFERL